MEKKKAALQSGLPRLLDESGDIKPVPAGNLLARPADDFDAGLS